MVPVPAAPAGARRRARIARPALPLALVVLAGGLAVPAAAEAKTATGTVTINKGNDYPYANRSPSGVDPWNFYCRECTSFVAWRVSRKVKGVSNGMKGGRFGNAITWDDNARKLGYVVDDKPTKGSVMVRNSGRYGHVAIVAKVGKGRIYVEQYNAGGTHVYSERWLAKTSVMSFIHFDRKR